MSDIGVAIEDDVLDKAQSKAVRRRSRKLLGSLLKPLRLRITLVALMVIIAVIGDVAGPMLLSYLIDTALPEVLAGVWDNAFLVVIAYAATGVMAAVLFGIFVVQVAVISQSVLFDLRQRLFNHAQRLSLEFHESYTSGRMISRQTNDLDSIGALLDSSLNELISGILTMVFILIALAILDPISALILTVGLIPLWFVFRWFQGRSTVLYRDSSSKSAKVIVQFVETMTGIRAVQAFRREKRNQKKYGEVAAEYRDVNLEMMNVFGVFFFSISMVGAVALGALVLAGGLRAMTGSLGIGTLLAIVLYARQFFQPIESVGSFYNSFQSAAAGLEKISGVLAEEPSVPEPTAPVPFGRSAW